MQTLLIMPLKIIIVPRGALGSGAAASGHRIRQSST